MKKISNSVAFSSSVVMLAAAVCAQTLILKPNQALDTILGIGGNYCFQIEHPTARYTLDNLKPTIARTEMTLTEWEPDNDDGDPNSINWSVLKATDDAGGNLRREFNLMKEFSAKKIPYVISVWTNPSWISDIGQEVPQTEWDELIESISSYLLYAKETYSAEPDWFSFNEIDYAINVKFSSKSHIAFIGKLGAKLEALGLKTRCLLGDVGKGSDGWPFVKNYTGQEEEMKYATAVTFHSWRGNTYAKQFYPLWREFATKLKKPLIVGETGPDPTAHSGAKYANFDYGILEMEHIMQLFIYARPQGIMQWEFTGDYDLLANGNPETERYAYFKHWIDFAPPGSWYVATEGGADDLLFAAFGDPKNRRLAMHCATPSTAKTATITGIPASITALKVVCTERRKLYQTQPDIQVSNGSAQVNLPPKAVTTLWAQYNFVNCGNGAMNASPPAGPRPKLLAEIGKEGVRFRRTGDFRAGGVELTISDIRGRIVWKTVFPKTSAKTECTWRGINRKGRPVRPGTYIATAGGGISACSFAFVR